MTDFVNTVVSFVARIFSKETLEFILNPEFEGWLLVLRNTFLFISGILGLLFIVLLFVSGWIRQRYTEDLYEASSYKPYGAKGSSKEWKRISARLESGKEPDYKLAVIEADDLLEENLREMGYKGAQMKDLLDQVPEAIVPNVGDVVQAHELRNNIVHDPDYKLEKDEAERVISVFEKALQELGVI